MPPKTTTHLDIEGTLFARDPRIDSDLTDLRHRVNTMRTIVGNLSSTATEKLNDYFRLKNIHNSNAIEGNRLSIGETQMVIRDGLTITGKPLKDSVEAKNLSIALEFFEELAARDGQPITLLDVRNIHNLILRGIDDVNAGRYRLVPVKISGSKYDPPKPIEVESEMREFGEWLEKVSRKETAPQIDPLIIACAVHTWFVIIHPFIDGNGRTARLLMNLILMRFGYPISIITLADKDRYYDALEISQDGGDLTPFIQLVHETVLESIEVYEQAAHDQIETEQYVKAVITEEKNRLRNEYEIFEASMRLLKVSFRQVVELLSEESDREGFSERVGFREFGDIEFDKYYSLRRSQSAKRTWFFRITFYDVNNQERRNRYLFFYGFASDKMSKTIGENRVSLHVSQEVYPHYYDKLTESVSLDIPDVIELSYIQTEETFVFMDSSEEIHRVKQEKIAQKFIREGFKYFRSN
jgi:Fic family protein